LRCREKVVGIADGRELDPRSERSVDHSIGLGGAVHNVN